MNMWLLPLVYAIVFRDSRTGLFLGEASDMLVMTPYPAEALDISLQDTDPRTISVILSLGTKALSVQKKSHRLDLADFNRNDKTQFFKPILTPDGNYILQHEDECVGYSGFLESTPNGTRNVMMVDCDDFLNLITFFKSERIDGEVRTRRIVTYLEQPGDEMHPIPIVQKGEKIEEFHEQLIRPEETGFLRGVLGRVTHLF